MPEGVDGRVAAITPADAPIEASDSAPNRPARARATINDVARVAGVSRQTVSNVVRSRGRVGASTRTRVAAAIDALGYQPHTGASSLRSQRTHRLAHPMPTAELTPSDLGIVEFLQAIVSVCGSRDQQLLLTRDTDEQHLVIQDLLRSGSVDGFLLAHLTVHDERVRLLAERGFPFACLGRTDPGMPQTWIDLDNRGAVRAATEHVIAKGHTRVSFLGYAVGYWDTDREQGYRDAMETAGLEPAVTLVGHELDALRASVSRCLSPTIGPTGGPTAIVTGDDLLATAVYSFATSRGMRIGVDLDVTGFGGGVMGRLLTPALTTMVVPVQGIATRLVDRLLKEIDSPTSEPGELVPVSLRIGESA